MVRLGRFLLVFMLCRIIWISVDGLGLVSVLLRFSFGCIVVGIGLWL